MRKSKWLTLSAMLAGGAILLQNGCLGAFWKGLSSGWPGGDNKWLGIAVDVANEIVFG